MQIYVSGIHSGPDPSAGVGVARSLKSAFPQANLVGVDYSAASSGIHYEVFDDIWVQRPWNELDLDLYRDQVAEALLGQAVWIPCLDLEIQWLAKVFPDEPRILAPSAAALEQVAKPAVPAARYLPMTVPEYALADKPGWDLYRFCRRRGWPVWCKGPYHEARLAWNWMQVQAAHLGYSVKTNPHRCLLKLARQRGLFAEVINGLEFAHAMECGFPLDRIILNGPAQGWPDEPLNQSPFAAFADSLERLRWFLENGVRAQFLGARLKPGTSASRFGADLSTINGFSGLVELLRRFDGQPLGVHFHIQSDVIGVRHWQEVFEGMLYSARALQAQSGKAIRILDVGGGWFPEDFTDEFKPLLPGLLKRAKEALPELQHFVVEPGKALSQPCMALVTRVLEVRRPNTAKGHTDVVVDGSIADLPQAPVFPHRILAFRPDGRPVPLSDGEDRVLGRNCMEFDFLSNAVKLPEDLREGERLVFCDAGAYDASMSYEFATGRVRNA